MAIGILRSDNTFVGIGDEFEGRGIELPKESLGPSLGFGWSDAGADWSLLLL